jgi:hypothetical protein
MAAGETDSAAFTTEENERRIPNNKISAAKDGRQWGRTRAAQKMFVRSAKDPRAADLEIGGAAGWNTCAAMGSTLGRRLDELITSDRQ